MLGMGGSQLYIPILFWMGMDFKTQAIPLGLLLNIVTSSSSSITYGLKKMINWKIAIPFSVTMMILAPVGTWLNINLPTEPIIIIFALFTAGAALFMLSGYKPKSGMSSKGHKIVGITGGSGLGFLAGLIGRGGGAFIVPLLYMTGIDTKQAIATSAFIVTMAATSGFVSHIFTAANPQLDIWILNVVAVIIGSQLGSKYMAAKLDTKKIKSIFGFVLLGVAAMLLIQNLFNA